MARKLNSPDDFEAFMREIDAVMKRDNVAIHLREIVALSEAAKLLEMELVGYPRKEQPTPGVYTAADLPGHIFAWVRHRYGDRLKLDFTNGYAVLPIRGDPWLLRFPIIYGSVNLICDQDLSRKSSGIKAVDPADRSTWPFLNVLSCIQELPQGLASKLTVAELHDVMQFFLFGHEFLNDLNSFCRDVPLAMSALADLNTSSRACVLGRQYGHSRWASLQAAEKLLKFYIQQRGESFPHTHDLSTLAGIAAELGLPKIDSGVITAVECDAGVRYEQRNHLVADVIAANHGVLTTGGTVVRTLYATQLHSSKPNPSNSEPPLGRPQTVSQESLMNKTRPLPNFRELAGNSPNRGRLLERLVAAMHVAETPDIETRWDDKIQGRQFDVTLRFRKGVHDYLTVIECKDFAEPVPVEKVEAFVTKATDVGANKAVMVSTAGFQSGAVSVAQKHNVRLFTIEEAFKDDEPVSGESVDGISFISLQFRVQGTGALLDVPARSARFGYIWKQGRVRRGQIELSIETLAQLERPSDFTTRPAGKEVSVIELGNEAELLIPHEDPVAVSSMTYERVLQTFTKPAEPLPKDVFLGFDPFLRERFQLKFILRDENGAVVQEEQLRGLPFGFDTKLEVGTFYESPALGFHYYLDKIEPNLLTWIAIETYQHDRLMQIVFTQKPEYATGMVAVTDPVVLNRLRRMLEAFKSRRGN